MLINPLEYIITEEPSFTSKKNIDLPFLDVKFLREVNTEGKFIKQRFLVNSSNFTPQNNASINDASSRYTSRGHVLVYNWVNVQEQSTVMYQIGKTHRSNLLNASPKSLELDEVLKLNKTKEKTAYQTSFDVDIFTSESNVIPEYSNKRLSVPFKPVYAMDNVSTPNNFDGWYTLYTFAAEEWLGNIQAYSKGTIVSVLGVGFFLAKEDSYDSINPLVSNKWVPETEITLSDWILYFHKVMNNPNTLSQIIKTECLLTATVKDEVIYPLILKSSYKTYDDNEIKYRLNSIIKARTKAVISLHSKRFLDMSIVLQDIFKTHERSSEQLTNTNLNAPLPSKYSL